MDIIRHKPDTIKCKTTDGGAEYEFLLEHAEDGSYRPYLIRLWGDADFKTVRKATKLVQDGHNYYVTMNPPPHSAQEAEQVAILWVEELEQPFSSAESSKRDDHSPAHQTLPPLPRLTEKKSSIPTVLRITFDVWRQMEESVGSRRAETGGPLGGSRDDFIVEYFHFDRSARRTGATYSPDHEELNRLFREEWNPLGINLLGFVHSHPPGIWRPSGGDLYYARDILRAIPDLPYLLLPIVKTKPDTGAFDIFPYAAVRDGNEIRIVQLKLEKVNAPGRLLVDPDSSHYPTPDLSREVASHPDGSNRSPKGHPLSNDTVDKQDADWK